MPSLTLPDMLRLDSRHVSSSCHVPRDRQVPNGQQAPSLTPHDMVRPDGHHILISHHVPRGRQVPNGH